MYKIKNEVTNDQLKEYGILLEMGNLTKRFKLNGINIILLFINQGNIIKSNYSNQETIMNCAFWKVANEFYNLTIQKLLKAELIEEIIPTSKYLVFDKVLYAGKKTFNIDVLNKEGVTLGVIKWNPGWRKYAFYIASGTLFDSECLTDLKIYMDQLMGDWKKEKN